MTLKETIKKTEEMLEATEKNGSIVLAEYYEAVYDVLKGYEYLFEDERE